MKSKFYIGQKVVAIKNQSQGDFKKGEVFTILDIRKSCCFFEVKIKNETELYKMICRRCGKSEISVPYYSEESFAPIQEQDISEMSFSEAISLVSEKEYA